MEKSSVASRRFESVEHLQQRPGFLLRRAHQISVAIFEKECAAVDLTPAQYGVLNVLGNSQGIDQSQLSRSLGLDRVTVLRVAKGLEARGLISRQPSQQDARRLSLSLTAQGETLLERAQPSVKTAFEALMSPFSAEELQTLTCLLNKLCTSLAGHARAEMECQLGKNLRDPS
nr:MarR family transcriptional regulator [Pseudomonas sp.]